MKNNRCCGLTKNLNRCSRQGDWRLFCGEHGRQWIGWLFTLIFTVVAGAASIYSVAPTILPAPAPSVPVPGNSNLERAISMAKMEGVKFNTPSATDVVAKFYVRPTVTSPLNNDLVMFALVSVSPFKPLKSESTFDAGDCRFLGYVISFDPVSKKAVLSVKTISCTDNANQAFTFENTEFEREPNGVLTELEVPTEQSLSLSTEKDGAYSVPMHKNVLLKFSPPVEQLKLVGKSFQRF